MDRAREWLEKLLVTGNNPVADMAKDLLERLDQRDADYDALTAGVEQLEKDLAEAEGCKFDLEKEVERLEREVDFLNRQMVETSA